MVYVPFPPPPALMYSRAPCLFSLPPNLTTHSATLPHDPPPPLSKQACLAHVLSVLAANSTLLTFVLSGFNVDDGHSCMDGQPSRVGPSCIALSPLWPTQHNAYLSVTSSVFQLGAKL